MVNEFLTLYPAISLDFNVGERPIDMVAEGYDLMIRTLPASDSTLVACKLAPWRHMLIRSPEYRDMHAESAGQSRGA